MSKMKKTDVMNWLKSNTDLQEVTIEQIQGDNYVDVDYLKTFFVSERVKMKNSNEYQNPYKQYENPYKGFTPSSLQIFRMMECDVPQFFEFQ